MRQRGKGDGGQEEKTRIPHHPFFVSPSTSQPVPRPAPGRAEDLNSNPSILYACHPPTGVGVLMPQQPRVLEDVLGGCLTMNESHTVTGGSWWVKQNHYIQCHLPS